MELRLPTIVTTRTDIMRLIRELESLERYFKILEQRGEDMDSAPLPKISKGLDAFAVGNNMNLHDQIVRKTLLEFMGFLKTSAPIMHFSFANNPSAQSMTKLIEWLRTEIHPRVLITVGVQPSIGGGCMVRTENKMFDFSFRRHFSIHRKELEAVFDDLVKESVKDSTEQEQLQAKEQAEAVAS